MCHIKHSHLFCGMFCGVFISFPTACLSSHVQDVLKSHYGVNHGGAIGRWALWGMDFVALPRLLLPSLLKDVAIWEAALFFPSCTALTNLGTLKRQSVGWYADSSIFSEGMMSVRSRSLEEGAEWHRCHFCVLGWGIDCKFRPGNEVAGMSTLKNTSTSS